jgi:hypothetical protein
MDLHVTSVGNVKSPSSGDETPLETSLAATQIEDFDLQSSSLDTETPERRLLAEKYPDIHFTGRAISSHGYDAILTGVVRMAEDGTVRWSWVWSNISFTLICTFILFSSFTACYRWILEFVGGRRCAVLCILYRTNLLCIKFCRRSDWARK